MPNRYLLLAFTALSITTGRAMADGAQDGHPASMCPGSLSEAQQLQCWQDQAKLQAAELQALQTAKKVDGETGESMLSDKSRQLTVPNVQLIYGTSSKTMSAVLVYSDGRSLTVHSGEAVPGDFTVQTIAANPPSVVLDHAGVPLVLLMGGNGSSLQSSSNDDVDGNAPSVPPSGPIIAPQGAMSGPAGMPGN